MNEIAARRSLLSEGRTKKLRRGVAFSKNDIECQEAQSGKIHFLRERRPTHILESRATYIDADVRSEGRRRRRVLMHVSVWRRIKVTLTNPGSRRFHRIGK